LQGKEKERIALCLSAPIGKKGQEEKRLGKTEKGVLLEGVGNRK